MHRCGDTMTTKIIDEYAIQQIEDNLKERGVKNKQYDVDLDGKIEASKKEIDDNINCNDNSIENVNDLDAENIIVNHIKMIYSAQIPTVEPVAPQNGSIYYDIVNNQLKIYNDGWKSVNLL